MTTSIDRTVIPSPFPDHNQLPDEDGTFVKNFQEHPLFILPCFGREIPCRKRSVLNTIIGLTQQRQKDLPQRHGVHIKRVWESFCVSPK